MLATRNFFKSMLRPASIPRRWMSKEEPIVVGNLEKSINRITLLGRVGIDPQLRGSDANPVVLFTLATNNNYRFETGEIQQKTEWHRISVFRPYLRNNVIQNVKKGHRLLVEGRLVYGEVVDIQGQTHTTSSIVASDVVCLSFGKQVEQEENEVSFP